MTPEEIRLELTKAKSIIAKILDSIDEKGKVKEHPLFDEYCKLSQMEIDLRLIMGSIRGKIQKESTDES